MLIEFRVVNYRSLRDEQVLTMEAGNVDSDDTRVRRVDGLSQPILPVAVLYGANASGKSNVLAALAFMRFAVTDSHHSWAPTEGVARDAFAWGPKKRDPSTFEATFFVAGVRHQYGFSCSDLEFIEEWLYAWPNGKKQMWFERERGAFKFGDHLKGENKLIEEITRPNALFLSAAVQNKHPQLTPVYRWFDRLRPINPIMNRYPFRRFLSSEIFVARMIEQPQAPTLFSNESPAQFFLDRFRSMLKSADIGIIDLRVNKGEQEEGSRRLRLPRFDLQHENSTNEAWLPLEQESNGTQTLFRMLPLILQSLDEGGVLVIDELEASLHPVLAQKIVGLFNESASNPNNAQLVFTTHDTNLLGSTVGDPILRRDQIWFTEKDVDGATVLYPLTNYMPRKSENLERGYLQGRYGAIPFLGNFTVYGE